MLISNTVRTVGLILVLALLVVGCSENNPINSSNSVQENTSGNRLSAMAGQVEFFGRIETVDPSTREITLVGNPTLVSVLSGAEVVFKDSGNETPITLDEINPGDSAEVRGDMQGNTLMADRVRIRPEDQVENELEISGRVETIDPALRTITLVGNTTLINVDDFAEIVQKASGEELPISLSDIVAGDSLDIRGNLQNDGSLLADRVRLRIQGNDDFVSDVEFKSVISSIDYMAGTFTVDSRTETIHTDDMTFIYAKVNTDRGRDNSAGLGDDDDDDDSDEDGWREPIAFTDLAAGDSVEVHANVIDASNLYAVAIELEDEDRNQNQEVEFKDTLATIDTVTGVVTFTNQSWTGTVAETAVLEDLNNMPITLGEFSPGQLVEVKGFKTGEMEFSIVRMEKENTL